MKYKGKKVRPSRIVEGFTGEIKSVITGNLSAEVINRRGKCDPCALKENGRCTLCGCFTDEKTQATDEYCPKNYWEDIKICDVAGMSLKNLSPEKVSIVSVVGNTFYVHYLSTLEENADSTINLRLINERSNFFDKDLTLSGIELKKGCGCMITSEPPTTLKDGESFDFPIKYNTERLGAFDKTVKLVGNDQIILNINLKGSVIKKEA